MTTQPEVAPLVVTIDQGTLEKIVADAVRGHFVHMLSGYMQSTNCRNMALKVFHATLKATAARMGQQAAVAAVWRPSPDDGPAPAGEVDGS